MAFPVDIHYIEVSAVPSTNLHLCLPFVAMQPALMSDQMALWTNPKPKPTLTSTRKFDAEVCIMIHAWYVDEYSDGMLL
jgi:hypothetical protein